MFQGFGPGAAWVLQRAGTDMAMLWTPDAHQCRVLARTADIETAQVYFRGVMEGVHTPQVSIRKLVDRDMEQAGRTYRQIGYVLQNEADSQGAARAFILTTFPAPDSPFAVIATVAATQRQ